MHRPEICFFFLFIQVGYVPSPNVFTHFSSSAFKKKKYTMQENAGIIEQNDGSRKIFFCFSFSVFFKIPYHNTFIIIMDEQI